MHASKYIACNDCLAEEHCSRNAGNHTYTAGGAALECMTGIPDPWTVGISFTCTATYLVTQADIDFGSASITARWNR